MTTRPRISVVVPSYQRRVSLLRCLASLQVQTISPAEYEVVATIDGSTDGSAAAARRLATPYRLRVIEQPNRGRAAACNSGVGAAIGELIVLLDDDMEASPGLLEAHEAMHLCRKAVGVVGAAPIVLAPGAPPLTRFRANGFQSRLQALGSPGGRLRFRDVYTGNFSIARELLLQVGGFDEEFGLYGHEDYELALRLSGAGVEPVFSPDAVAYQHYEKTLAAAARDGMERGHTAVLFARKHPEIAGQLKLGDYERETPKWKALRSALLLLTRLRPGTAQWIVAFVTWLERREPARLNRYYAMALDYFFWAGAEAALRTTSGGPPPRRVPILSPNGESGA